MNTQKLKVVMADIEKAELEWRQRKSNKKYNSNKPAINPRKFQLIGEAIEEKQKCLNCGNS